MGQAVYRVGALPEAAIDASAAFYAQHLPAISLRAGEGPESLVVIFPEATYDHRTWRRAAIADLARAYAPVRIVGLAQGDSSNEARILAYLAAAPGVTGQMFNAFNDSDSPLVETSA